MSRLDFHREMVPAMIRDLRAETESHHRFMKSLINHRTGGRRCKRRR